ncbi:MAG TPA: VapE domain-containing protein [Anaerolineae bacterium]|nr:VapE domain-containing protein [Anaerolineae bacterium]
MKPLETVLSHFQGVKQEGDYWMALSPLRDERQASVQISERPDGSVGVYDHGAGKEATADLLRAAGLSWDDLYPPREAQVYDRTKKAKQAATYDYRDEKGTLLYQVVRYEPGFDGERKTFRPRRPNGGTGWVNGLGDVRRVLYRLPDLAASDAMVYVVEGEKSADALGGLGVLATCNPGGANKWREEYTDALKGRDVVILPDNDGPGLAHGYKVLHELKDKADRVRFLNLGEGKGTGYDAYDWVHDGGSLGELLSLLQKAPEHVKQPDGVRDIKYPKSDEYINVLAALGYVFKMNRCNDRVEVNGDPISDALEAKLKTQLRDLGYPRVNVARDAYIAHAFDNSYHPVQEYLQGLRWDGQDHISYLAAYFTDRHDVFPTYLRRWLVGACAKAFEAEQNRMLVLDGRQNLGKSHFVRWLVPMDIGREYLVEGPIQPDNKDDLIRLISAWVWEVAELGSTARRADREALKYFLSMRQVTVRAPYGHYDLVKPAMASFIGTVNNETGILSDPTGHRRFMVCNVTEIGWDYAKLVDVRQVWAQAYKLYCAGEPWELTKGEAERATEINEEYEMVDVLEDYFHQAFEITGDALDFMPTTEILFHLHGAGWTGERTQRLEAMDLSRLMTKLKVEKGRSRIDGEKAHGYTGLQSRPPKPQAELPV